MGRTLRGSLVAAVACLLLAQSPGDGQPVRPPPPLTVEADPAHPVLVGGLSVRVARPAERIELLLAVDAQSSVEANRAATAALLDVVRGALPGVPATAAPGTGLAAALRPLGGGPYGGFVRVDLPRPTGDAALRTAVSRVRAALSTRAQPGQAGHATLVSVAHGYASCTPFVTLGAAAAGERIEAYARALGTPAQPPALQDRSIPPHAIDGPQYAEPLCGDAHAARASWVELPSTVSFVMPRTYGFAQRMRFAAPSTAAERETVPVLWGGPQLAQRVRVRARTPVITLEGHAVLERHRTRMLYEYRGPSGRYYPRDVTEAHLAEIRGRLRALGIAESDIVTQLEPSNGRWYVVAYTHDTAPDDRVVTALAGSSSAERHGVRAVAYGESCLADPAAIRRATADAASRAVRIGTLLGSAVDAAHPIAVALQHGAAIGECPLGTALPALPNPIPRHAGGTLRTARAIEPDTDDVYVVVTFPLADRPLAGPDQAQPATDNEMSNTARFGFAAPPVDYPDASLSGEARRERRLRPDRVRIEMELLPDHANGFRPIDPGFAASLASRLGARDADYTAAFVPSQVNQPNGEPEPDGLEFIAVVPYRADETVRAATAALHSSYSAGYGGFNVVPQRDACGSASDELARDAIRAAAAQAHAPPRARLIGIDLRGPFAADGTCRPGPDGNQNWSVREVTIPDVRLAAYARVSYAAR